jgi:ribosomal RNA assembly protein
MVKNQMRYIRIPHERIGVLIGPQGETKKIIEQQTNISLEIDSDTGEVQFNEQDLTDPMLLFKIENVIRAIGRGFSPEHALHLLSDEMDLFIFDLHDYVGKKPSQVQRLKSRVIGTHGKTRRHLEEVSNSYISVYGHTVALIGSIFSIDITKKAVDKLLSGSKHATVYQFIEKQMKKLRQDLI